MNYYCCHNKPFIIHYINCIYIYFSSTSFELASCFKVISRPVFENTLTTELFSSVMFPGCCTSCETSEQDNTPTASATSVSHVVTDGVRAPHSQPPPVPADGRCESQAPSAQPACKKVPLPNIPQASNHSGPTLLSGDGPNPSGCVTSAAQKPEGDYDVLPLRKCQAAARNPSRRFVNSNA